jgi:hypothetical protein
MLGLGMMESTEEHAWLLQLFGRPQGVDILFRIQLELTIPYVPPN